MLHYHHQPLSNVPVCYLLLSWDWTAESNAMKTGRVNNEPKLTIKLCRFITATDTFHVFSIDSRNSKSWIWITINAVVVQAVLTCGALYFYCQNSTKRQNEQCVRGSWVKNRKVGKKTKGFKAVLVSAPVTAPSLFSKFTLLLCGRSVLTDFIDQLLYWDASEGGGRQVDRWKTNKRKSKCPSVSSLGVFFVSLCLTTISVSLQVSPSVFIHVLMHPQQHICSQQITSSLKKSNFSISIPHPQGWPELSLV